jgi:hypothetical protein
MRQRYTPDTVASPPAAPPAATATHATRSARSIGMSGNFGAARFDVPHDVRVDKRRQRPVDLVDTDHRYTQHLLVFGGEK